MNDSDIAQLAKKIAIELKTCSTLGFCDAPRDYTRVYLDGDFPGIWYTLSGEMDSSERIPIKKEAIKGKIVGIEKKTVTSNNEPTDKLDVTILAGQTYILRMGWNTAGMRSLLRGILSISPEAILSPVTIRPYLLGDRAKDLDKNTAKKCVCFDFWDASGNNVYCPPEFQDLKNGDDLFDMLLTRSPELRIEPKVMERSTAEEHLPPPVAAPQVRTDDRRLELRKSILDKAKTIGWSTDYIRQRIKSEFGASSSQELSIQQLETFLSLMIPDRETV